MTEQQLQLLNDARLSDAARILGLYLSTLPAGPQELPHDRLAALLHGCPNADTVGRHLRQLDVFGYAQKVSNGGKGSPRYEWLEVSARENSRAEASLPAKIHGQKPTVVEGEEEVIPPNPLSGFSLDVRALQAISDAGDKLAGCRDALRDYLQARVPSARQYAYVQSVVSWLDNPGQVFQGPNGLAIPQPERVKMLAIALNEMAASDERSYKAPVGDVRNVRTKVGILSRLFGQKATGTDGRTYQKRGASDEQQYTPTDHWDGVFNG